MPRIITREIVRPLKLMSEVYAYIESVWEEPLRAEGFARSNIYDPTKPADTKDEIDSLVDYQRLVSWLGNTRYDRDNRERMLIEFVETIFSHDTLARTILPRKSFVEKVVRQLAMLYKQEPTRWLSADGELHPADMDYQSLISEADIASRGKEWYRKFVLTRCVCVRPVVRRHRGRGVLTYDVLTPNEFRVQFDENNELSKLLYQVYVEGEHRVAVWTRDEHYYRDVRGQRVPVGENTDMVNPYKDARGNGIIPAVIITDDPTAIYGGGLFGLVEANLYNNFLELLQTSDIAFTALSVWVAKNMRFRSDEVLSPGRVFAFDDIRDIQGGDIAPSLENVTATPHTTDIRDLMDAVYRRAAVDEGISAAMLETQMREMSGRALREMKAELIDRRSDDADIMSDHEASIYEVTAIVANYARATNRIDLAVELPADSEVFSIDFADEDFADLDAEKKYALEMQQVKDGLLSVVDMYRRYNADADDTEDVIEIMQRNKAEYARIAKSGAARSWLADLIGGDNTATPDNTGAATLPVPPSNDTMQNGNVNADMSQNMDSGANSTAPNTAQDVLNKLTK